VGDEVWLKIGDQKRKWKVVGIVSLVGQPYAYANFDYLSRVQGTPGQAYALFLGTDDKTAKGQQTVADNLEERFKRSGIGVSQSITQQTIIGANVSQFNFLIGFMLVMAVMLAVVGGLGLAGTMSLNVLERTREIGVMRAIGASNGSVRSVVLVEGVLIGLLSWVVAQAVAIPASIGFAAAIGYAFFERPLPTTFSTLGAVAWLLIVLAIATIASLLPARRAARISVRESLAYE
jgi:putative ABC transport system permease protein